MNPKQIWAELQIEPTNDARAIKRAYAIRLKTDRSAKEPAQFILLREAYEAALVYAERNVLREAPQTAPDNPPLDPPPSALPPVPLAEIEPESEPAPPPVKPRVQAQVDAERRAKPIPMQHDSLHPLMAALYRELQTQDNEPALLEVVRLILAHQNIQRFTSRDQTELEIIHLLVSFPPKSPMALQMMDSEFGWSQDHINLLHRCPQEGHALLRLIEGYSEKPEQQVPASGNPKLRKAALHALNAEGLNRWIELIFSLSPLRAQIDALLNGPDAASKLQEERRQWWKKNLKLFPPINIGLSVVLELLVVIVLGVQISAGQMSDNLVIGAFVMLAIPFFSWLTITLPLHFAQQQRGPFTAFWMAVAASVFIFPRIPETYAWWSPYIPAGLGILAMFMLLPPYLHQQQLEQYRRNRFAIFSGLTLIVIAAIFSFPQHVEIQSWVVPLTMIVLGYVLALTMMRLSNAAGNDVLIVFLMLISCVLIGVLAANGHGFDIHIVENSKYLFLNMIWLSEATIYCCGANDSKPAFERVTVVVAALSAAALLLSFTPLPIELRLILLFGILLAGEYLAPLNPFNLVIIIGKMERFKKYGAKHLLHFTFLVAFELMFIHVLNLTPPMSQGIYQLPFVILNAMVATRVLWFLLQHIPATFKKIRSAYLV